MTPVHIHPHAQLRMQERGATEEEVIETIYTGESFEAKFGRTGFRRNFARETEWRGKFYPNKQLEVYAVMEENGWTAITVLVKYF